MTSSKDGAYTIPKIAADCKVKEFHVRRLYDRLVAEGRIANAKRFGRFRMVTLAERMIIEDALRVEGYI